MTRALYIFLAATALFTLHGLRGLGAQPTVGIESGVKMSWATTTGNTYQVRWSANADGGPWANLGGPVMGNGTTNSLYDPVPRGVRHYRVWEMVPGSAPAASI